MIYIRNTTVTQQSRPEISQFSGTVAAGSLEDLGSALEIGAVPRTKGTLVDKKRLLRPITSQMITRSTRQLPRPCESRPISLVRWLPGMAEALKPLQRPTTAMSRSSTGKRRLLPFHHPSPTLHPDIWLRAGTTKLVIIFESLLRAQSLFINEPIYPRRERVYEHAPIRESSQHHPVSTAIQAQVSAH